MYIFIMYIFFFINFLNVYIYYVYIFLYFHFYIKTRIRETFSNSLVKCYQGHKPEQHLKGLGTTIDLRIVYKRINQSSFP